MAPVRSLLRAFSSKNVKVESTSDRAQKPTSSIPELDAMLPPQTAEASPPLDHSPPDLLQTIASLHPTQAADPASLLEALPPELLQNIANILPPAAAACLALCNTNVLRKVGTQYLSGLKPCRKAKRSFLSLLQRDIPGLIFCHHCDYLHHPSKLRNLTLPLRDFELSPIKLGPKNVACINQFRNTNTHYRGPCKECPWGFKHQVIIKPKVHNGDLLIRTQHWFFLRLPHPSQPLKPWYLDRRTNRIHQRRLKKKKDLRFPTLQSSPLEDTWWAQNQQQLNCRLLHSIDPLCLFGPYRNGVGCGGCCGGLHQGGYKMEWQVDVLPSGSDEKGVVAVVTMWRNITRWDSLESKEDKPPVPVEGGGADEFFRQLAASGGRLSLWSRTGFLPMSSRISPEIKVVEPGSIKKGFEGEGDVCPESGLSEEHRRLLESYESDEEL